MSSITLPRLPERTLHKGDTAALLEMLTRQQARKLDVVVPAKALRIERGYLLIDGVEAHFDETGAYDLNGLYSLTDAAIGDLAAAFKIPVIYLRRCRSENLRAFCNAVNDWARYETDRKVLVRLLWGSTPGDKDSRGIARAVLSTSYGFRDNLDMATAFLEGLRLAGITGSEVVAADMSDDYLYMRVTAREIAVAAPELLGNYRSPFNGRTGAECPIVFAGVEFRNSETGHGRTMVAPRLEVEICGNGMTFTEQAVTQVHRGAKLELGEVAWRADTYAAENTLFTRKIRDAVTTFLTPDYVRTRLDQISGEAQVPLADPQATLTRVGDKLRFTEAERAGIWKHFVAGGDVTAGGVLHAVTSYAQILTEGGRIDRGNEFATLGLNALTLAAAHA